MNAKVGILAATGLLIVIAAVLLAHFGGSPRLNSKARREWKDTATAPG